MDEGTDTSDQNPAPIFAQLLECLDNRNTTDEDGDFEHFTASLALPHPDATGADEQKNHAQHRKKHNGRNKLATASQHPIAHACGSYTLAMPLSPN
jgi:hypothetical protein